MLDGRHVTTFKAGERIDMVAPTIGGKHVYVVTADGLRMMYGLDLTPPETEK